MRAFDSAEAETVRNAAASTAQIASVLPNSFPHFFPNFAIDICLSFFRDDPKNGLFHKHCEYAAVKSSGIVLGFVCNPQKS
jgi:hypothetical protein